MALVTPDRVLESSTTTGTGALTLAGAHTGYRTFASVCSTNDTIYYAIVAVDVNGNPSGDWECGLGTYSGTNTLTRTTPQASTNSNNAVNFAAGTKHVYAAETAAALALFAKGAVTGGQLTMSTAKLLGRTTGSTGAIEEISIGSGLTFAAGSLSASAGASYEAGPAATLPDVSGWTDWNIGTSSFVTSSHSYILTPQNGAKARGKYTTVPTAPFNIYMRFHLTGWAAGILQNWGGILLRNNADGTSRLCGVNGTSSPRWEIGRFVEAGTTGSSVFADFCNVYGVLPWIRINVTSTTITMYISHNGWDWISIGTDTISGGIGAVTHYGFADLIDGTNVGAMCFDYFSTTAPS